MTKWMLLDVVSDFLHDWVMFGLEHTCFLMVKPHQIHRCAIVSYRWTNQNKGLLYSIHNIYIYIYMSRNMKYGPYNNIYYILYYIYICYIIYICYNIYICHLCILYLKFTTQKWWVSVNWISIGHVAILRRKSMVKLPSTIRKQYVVLFHQILGWYANRSWEVANQSTADTE